MCSDHPKFSCAHAYSSEASRRYTITPLQISNYHILSPLLGDVVALPGGDAALPGGIRAAPGGCGRSPRGCVRSLGGCVDLIASNLLILF